MVQIFNANIPIPILCPMRDARNWRGLALTLAGLVANRR
jgi:hypothetical protein